MLQYYDFSISKATDCSLTICDMFDTLTTPDGDEEIQYDLLVPATQTSEIATISSIEVTKKNMCDDTFTPIEYTIFPINQEAGTMTYNVSIGTGAGSSDEEQLIWANALVDVTNITKYTVAVKRSTVTIFTDEFTIPSTTHTVTYQEVIGQNPSVFQTGDVVELITTYDNGVTTVTSWQFGSVGAGDVGDPSNPVYTDMIVDSSNVYILDVTDCLELITDLDAFGDWDGIWGVQFKVNYVDANGDNKVIITTRCAFVDCDNSCNAVKKISELLSSSEIEKAMELAMVKEMIEWSTDCNQCCAACDALYLYNNRIKGNCKNC